MSTPITCEACLKCLRHPGDGYGCAFHPGLGPMMDRVFAVLGKPQSEQDGIPWHIGRILWPFFADHGRLPNRRRVSMLLSESGQHADLGKLSEFAGEVMALMTKVYDTFGEGFPVYGEKVSDFRAEMEEIFKGFLDEWMKEPPLVRAADAYGYSDIATRRSRDIAGRLARGITGGKPRMPRRARIDARFVSSSRKIADLFADLANAADREAEEAGIDLDERYRSDGDPIAEAIGYAQDVRWGSLAEKDVVEAAARGIAKDMEAEVSKEIALAGEKDRDGST